MFKSISVAPILGIVLGSFLCAQAQNVTNKQAVIEHDATGRSFGMNPGPSPLESKAQDQQTAQPPISYHGGGVLKGNVNVYLIWYGSHSASTESLIPQFLNGLSGSPYLYVDSTYSQGDGRQAATAITVQGSSQDNYSRGRTITEADILTIVGSAITSSGLPLDQSGIYFVLTSADVQMPGFGTSYCGWHSKGRVNGTPVRFAFVGDPARSARGCSVQPTVSPNGNPSADAMVNIVAHELVESITDPNLDAWYDDRGQESADKCAWQFGPVLHVANGSLANLFIGGSYFLVQETWVNSGPGYCALHM